MQRVGMETAVGIFMLLGILSLAWLSVKLAKMEILGGADYYRLSAYFDSVSGLRAGAPVEIAGVEVGRVEAISYDQEKKTARVEVAIENGIVLQDDVIASVRTSGIIGDKFIKLKPGGAGEPLKPGGRIRDTESAVDIEELVSKFIHGKVD